ncbi:MAG TPA: dihydroorotase, partial [Deltaproteobacteria bacterium]|nr:dihydroorotase [Deltaproteobacteria bacterium]
MASTSPDSITIRRPDDWHVHFRDGARLASVVAATAAQFGRAIVMPNLKPPVTTTAAAVAYKQRIVSALATAGGRTAFDPLMTLYLTDETHPDEIDRALDSGVVFGAKLYPAGATTNSAAGVTDVRRVDAVVARMAELGLPLLVHGEVTNPRIDVFDREARFLEDVFAPLLERHPTLKAILEHVTTAAGVDFVRDHGPRVAATITAHHLIATRNDMLVGGIKPHYYCLPILKRFEDREALVAAATSDDPSFFLGTDSAPHTIDDKESACGCAGCYTAHAAMEFYTEVFEEADALDKLEAFASLRGPAFYGLPVHNDTITLTRKTWHPKTSMTFGNSAVHPWRSNLPLRW